jgi:hypothetical protein
MKKSCRTFWEFNRYNVGISKDLKFKKKAREDQPPTQFHLRSALLCHGNITTGRVFGLRVCLPSVSDVVVALDRLTVRSSARDESLQTAAR